MAWEAARHCEGMNVLVRYMPDNGLWERFYCETTNEYGIIIRAPDPVFWPTEYHEALRRYNNFVDPDENLEELEVVDDEELDEDG
jgi:hypothetical protein